MWFSATSCLQLRFLQFRPPPSPTGQALLPQFDYSSFGRTAGRLYTLGAELEIVAHTLVALTNLGKLLPVEGTIEYELLKPFEHIGCRGTVGFIVICTPVYRRGIPQHRLSVDKESLLQRRKRPGLLLQYERLGFDKDSLSGGVKQMFGHTAGVLSFYREQSYDQAFGGPSCGQ